MGAVGVDGKAGVVLLAYMTLLASMCQRDEKRRFASTDTEVGTGYCAVGADSPGGCGRLKDYLARSPTRCMP